MATSMTPEEQAAAMAAVKIALNTILTPLLVATFVSCVLLGVVVALGLTYFIHFPSDRIGYKLLVTTLICGSLADTAATSSWAYDFAVEDFGHPENWAAWPHALTAYCVITGSMVLVAQCFFIWRLWVVSGKRWILPGVTLAVALAAAGACTYLFYWNLAFARQMTDFLQVRDVCLVWLGLELGVDILITGGMIWYLLLRPKRMGGSDAVHSSPLKRIVVHTVETNTASLVLQLLVVILMSYSINNGTLHLALPGFLEVKTYSISVIATLLARRSTHDGHTTSPSHTTNNNTGTRSKGLGARLFSHGGTRSAVPTNSVHVQIEHEVAVDHHRDESVKTDFGREVTPASLGKYSVQFDVEDGRSESEKGARY